MDIDPCKKMPVYNTHHVDFPRSSDAIDSRQKLPIFKEEFEIMEAVIDNDIVVISGATGSGKTTQVPQFLLEAGFGHSESKNPGKILMTQPRRLAVVSSAERIRFELGAENIVSYRTRHQSSVFSSSILDIVTDGVLIRELVESPLLNLYSVVIIDEVHERSYNNDILISLICRLIRARNDKSSARPPLRLILMSATLQDDIFQFVSSYGSVKKIVVQGQSFPVSVHYNRDNPEDYVLSTFKKIEKILNRLPTGKILAFLPSKADLRACRDLLSDNKYANMNLNVFCVHGSMNQEQQTEIFCTTRSGIDIFLATNVAETSITIPEVAYVVDSGKSKRKIYDNATGTYKFLVGWISKASSEQRMGRTGRTNAGHCYRLYTAETFYDTFVEHDSPEISSMCLDGHVLLCKRLGIEPLKLQMPTMPLEEQYQLSINRLTQLNVINNMFEIRDEYLLICLIPIIPECAKTIVDSILNEHDIKCLSLAVLFGLTSCYDEIMVDRSTFASSYKPYFKSDVIFDSYLVSGYFEGKYKDGILEKTMEEIGKMYDVVGKIIFELIDEKIYPISKICFKKSTCDAVRSLLKKSPRYLTALRSDLCAENSRHSYLCCDNELKAFISRRSFLYSDSPRVVSFRGRVMGSNGKCILTRLTDISK